MGLHTHNHITRKMPSMTGWMTMHMHTLHSLTNNYLTWVVVMTEVKGGGRVISWLSSSCKGLHHHYIIASVLYIAVCTILVEVETLVVTASHFSMLVRRATRWDAVLASVALSGGKGLNRIYWTISWAVNARQVIFNQQTFSQMPLKHTTQHCI